MVCDHRRFPTVHAFVDNGESRRESSREILTTLPCVLRCFPKVMQFLQETVNHRSRGHYRDRGSSQASPVNQLLSNIDVALTTHKLPRCKINIPSPRETTLSTLVIQGSRLLLEKGIFSPRHPWEVLKVACLITMPSSICESLTSCRKCLVHARSHSLCRVVPFTLKFNIRRACQVITLERLHFITPRREECVTHLVRCRRCAARSPRRCRP